MDEERVGIGKLTLLMALVWAFSWAASWAVGWSVVRFIGLGYSFFVGGQVGGMVAGIIAGVIGGLGTALVLKLAAPSAGLKNYHIILLAGGWAAIVFYDWSDGFVVAAPGGYPIEFGVGGALSGILGGILTALILWWADHALSWKQLFLIVAGWTLGFSLAGLIAWTIGANIALGYVLGPIYGNDSGLVGLLIFTVISGLSGALAGWFGGAATIRSLSPKSRPEDKTDEATEAISTK